MQLTKWNPFKFKRARSRAAATTPRAEPQPAPELAQSEARTLAPTTQQSMPQRMWPTDPLGRMMTQMLSDRFMRDPFAPFADLDRFFGDFAPSMFQPSIDIVDDGKQLRITAELPGMNKDDIELSVDEGVLYIRGEKRSEETSEEEGCYRTERYFGHFSRAIPLPEDIDADKADAKFEAGVLTLRLPKRKVEASKSKPIEIKA